jgi:hypothetical protein
VFQAQGVVALATEINRLQQELETERQRRTAFDATYSYGKERIVELAQVIMRDLENCPEDINKNKMFQCVSTINRDWEKKWADNPKHMVLDFAMLLSVCRASTWFSKKQKAQILKWQNAFNTPHANLQSAQNNYNDDDDDYILEDDEF